jgi:(2Fe-2S) ferredoxin
LAKLGSLDELKKYAAARSVGRADKTVLAVGAATCGIAAGAKDTIKALEDAIKANGVSGAEVVETGCLGFCYAEPLVEVRAPGAVPVRYAGVDAALARRIIKEHIIGGAVVEGAILSKEVPR